MLWRCMAWHGMAGGRVESEGVKFGKFEPFWAFGEKRANNGGRRKGRARSREE